MYRAEPVFNKKLIHQWHKENYTSHRHRLEDIVHSQNPHRSHSQIINRNRNKKREQQEAEENERISNNNKILFKRLANIINGSGSSEAASISQSYSKPNELPHKKSLNCIRRKEDLIQLVNDNKKLLDRLQNRKSFYDVNKWHKEETERKKFLQLACDYPLYTSKYQKQSSMCQKTVESTKMESYKPASNVSLPAIVRRSLISLGSNLIPKQAVYNNL